MPLYADGKSRIRLQLQRIARGEHVGVVDIGELTPRQFDDLRRQKREAGLAEPGSPGLVYKGKHHYNSRVAEDGYQLKDLVLQIESALAVDSMVVTKGRSMTALVSAFARRWIRQQGPRPGDPRAHRAQAEGRGLLCDPQGRCAPEKAEGRPCGAAFCSRSFNPPDNGRAGGG